MASNDDDEDKMSPQERDWHDYTNHRDAWDAGVDPSKDRPERPADSSTPSAPTTKPSNSGSCDCFIAALMILLGLVIFGMICFFAFYKM